MTFVSYLEKYKKTLNKELEIIFDEYLEKSNKISPVCGDFMRSLKDFSLRNQSKRIRAMLVIIGYEGFGGKNFKEIVKTAAFIEIIHNYLLMHDDIIDNDDIRRGQPSIHKYFEITADKLIGQADIKHFGLSMGILAGDLCGMIGYDVLINSNFKDKDKVKAIKILNNLLHDVAFGEILDVTGQYKEFLTEKEILTMYEYKTARYTFLHPLQIGAVLAGASDEDLKKITGFAIPAGIAYQIKDDILGLMGDETKIGKPIGSDLREGKKTLLIMSALAKANINDKKNIIKSLGNKKINLKTIEKIRKIVADLSALEYCQNFSNKKINESKKALINLKKLKNVSDVLINLLDYIDQRTY